jgi:hypothetical protein
MSSHEPRWPHQRKVPWQGRVGGSKTDAPRQEGSIRQVGQAVRCSRRVGMKDRSVPAWALRSLRDRSCCARSWAAAWRCNRLTSLASSPNSRAAAHWGPTQRSRSRGRLAISDRPRRRQAPEPTGAACTPPLSWEQTTRCRPRRPTCNRERAIGLPSWLPRCPCSPRRARQANDSARPLGRTWESVRKRTALRPL